MTMMVETMGTRRGENASSDEICIPSGPIWTIQWEAYTRHCKAACGNQVSTSTVMI